MSNNPGKGIVLDNSHHNTLQNLSVHDIGDEGVHFRTSSTYNTIKNSTLYRIGLTQPQYGEGVYIGSAKSNWSTYMGSSTTPDASHYNQVLNNHIGPNIGAEAVDVKEGSFYGLIQGNTFEMSGIAGQNSGDTALDMKGDNYTVTQNTVLNDPTVPSTYLSLTGQFKDGFQINANTVNGITYGSNNTFSNNSVNLNTSGNAALNPAMPQGYAINVQGVGLIGNIICSNNTATNGNGSVSNASLSTCP